MRETERGRYDSREVISLKRPQSPSSPESGKWNLQQIPYSPQNMYADLELAITQRLEKQLGGSLEMKSAYKSELDKTKGDNRRYEHNIHINNLYLNCYKKIVVLKFI